MTHCVLGHCLGPEDVSITKQILFLPLTEPSVNQKSLQLNVLRCMKLLAKFLSHNKLLININNIIINFSQLITWVVSQNV